MFRSPSAPLFFALLISLPAGPEAQAGRWATLAQANTPIPREECSFAQAGGRFYLLGGRGVNPVQEFNPATRTWRNLKNTPVELNHFQAVSVSGLIYVIGAFGGAYPHEVPVPNVYVLDPLGDTWVKGAPIPPARLRGSAGLVEHQGRLYSVLGIQDGHSAGWVPWLDEYDPATNAWKVLPDAPRERDHFQAAVCNGRIYAIGGRRSGKPDIFADLEKVDVFDLATLPAGGVGGWSTLPSPAGDLKIRRSGSIVAALGDEVIVAGGGSTTNGNLAHSQTDALHAKTRVWRSLAPLNRGRQVTGGFVNNGALYVASGSGGSGGSPTLTSQEAYFPGDSTAPTGEPLVAGRVAAAGDENPFNLGLAPAGQTLTRVLSLRHSAGNQGVLVGDLRVVGDAAFKVKSALVYPFLVRPGYPVSIELTYASTGTVPPETHLEVTLAIPAGVVVKLPLEANRKAVGVLRGAGAVRAFRPARGWLGGWIIRDGKSWNLKGRIVAPLLP